MNQFIELDDVRLERVGNDLVLTHKKSQTQIVISEKSLQSWLIRQLRLIFA
jgi:hypothetical protein